MSWEGQHPNCVCTKSMGDTKDCAMHAEVYEQRQAGCSCWAGWLMPDGTRVDMGCDADEYHTRNTASLAAGASESSTSVSSDRRTP